MPELIVEGRTRTEIDFRSIAAGRLLNQIDNLVDDMPGRAAKAREERATKEAQLEDFKARVGLEFERGGELVLACSGRSRSSNPVDRDNEFRFIAITHSGGSR